MANACGSTAAATGATAADDVAVTDDAQLDTGTADVAQLDTGTADVAPDAAGTDAAAADTTAADSMVDAGPMVEKSTKSGKYTLDLVGPTTIKSGQKGTYTLTVIDDQGNPVPGLTIKVAFVMSGMSMGGSGVPKSTDNGDGTYSITGIVPSMGGGWLLEVTVGGEMVKFDITAG